jgi:hypothetical protein
VSDILVVSLLWNMWVEWYEHYQHQAPCLLAAVIAQWYGAGLRAGWSVVRVSAGAGNFPFTTAPRPALGPTQPPIQWVQGLFPWGWSDRGMKLTTQLHLVRRSKNARGYNSTHQYAFLAWCSVKKSIGTTLPFTLPPVCSFADINTTR